MCDYMNYLLTILRSKGLTTEEVGPRWDETSFVIIGLSVLLFLRSLQGERTTDVRSSQISRLMLYFFVCKSALAYYSLAIY